MIGCLLGIILTYPAAQWFIDAMGTYLPVFNVERQTLGLDVIAAVLVGIVAALLPTWRAVHLKIADNLKRIG